MFTRVYDKKRRAQVDLLLTQSTRSGVTMIVVTTLIAWVVWPSFPNHVVISWMCTGYFINLSRKPIYSILKNRASKDSVYLWLENTLAIQLFISGLFWGITCWLFLIPEDTASFVFVALAVVAIAPSALPVFSALPYIWFIYATPLLLITSAKLYSIGLWELALLAIINLIGLTPLCRNLGRSIEKSITLDIENATLLEEVSEAKEKAEKANLAKSQFLAAASHDLRQPLHVQGILLEALKLRLENQEQLGLLEKAMQSNDALNGLFNALLEISQLDAGTVRVNKSHQHLMEICEELVNEYKVFMEDNGLYAEVCGDDVVVITDPVLLGRVLRNLLDNAIKYTEVGGIKIQIEAGSLNTILRVSDTGVGIPLSQQAHIFDEYYQLDNAARDRTKGIGLGLALVRRMCEQLQHDIQIESAVGEGTCFTLTLPIGDASKVIDQPKELEKDPLSHIKVLIVDDEQSILDAMTVMLSDWACYPRTFTSLAAAEKAIEKEGYKPDLIISDYRLKEDVTGLDVIKTLKKKYKDNIPALIITGDTDPRLLERLHHQDYYILHKPVKSMQLKKVIRILLKK